MSQLSTTTFDYQDIDAFLALQNAVPQDKKHFVKPRTKQDLRSHLDADMPLLGVYDGDDLIAAAVLTFESGKAHAKNLEGYDLDQHTAVLQSVVSSRRGTMGLLIGAAKEEAFGRGCNKLSLKVNTENECAISAFTRKGFAIDQTCADPAGGSYTAHFMSAVFDDVPDPKPQKTPLPADPCKASPDDRAYFEHLAQSGMW